MGGLKLLVTGATGLLGSEDVVGARMRDWQEALEAFLDEEGS